MASWELANHKQMEYEVTNYRDNWRNQRLRSELGRECNRDVSIVKKIGCLRVRYDRRADIHEAFLSLGCALICWHSLRKTLATR